MDDEPALCEIFESWLTSAGCKRVLTAQDGVSALAVFATNAIDVLVSDIRMPRMDGVTLVHRLNEMGILVPIIIFVSGFGSFDPREIYSIGVEAFLSKPLNRADLLGALGTALSERSALWRTPMEIAPQQSLEIDMEGAGEENSKDRIQLGHGGFSTRFAGWLSLGKVEFHCRLDGEKPNLAGQGYVRWRSKSDRTAGIEFAYLEEPCRSWVLERLAAKRPPGFIPIF